MNNRNSIVADSYSGLTVQPNLRTNPPSPPYQGGMKDVQIRQSVPTTG